MSAVVVDVAFAGAFTDVVTTSMMSVVTVIHMSAVVVDVAFAGAFTEVVSVSLIMAVHQSEHRVTHLCTVNTGHSGVVLEQSLYLHVYHVSECVVAMLLLLLVWPVVAVGIVVDLCHGESQASKEDNCDFHGGW